MADDHIDKKNQKDGMSRRKFLKNTGYVTGGVVGGGILGSILGSGWWSGSETQPVSTTSENNFEEARMFFKREEDFKILEKATETIFPEDDYGPGAIDLGVPYFIDRQLAGAWGSNTRDYMKGPFQQGSETQGYQAPLTRGGVFLQGLRQINQIAIENYDEPFFDLKEEDRVSILTEFSEGEVDMQSGPSDRFFNMLRTAVLEGAYADPLYGGNKNMAGWRMKQHPGAVMS